jgi:hypothetical protein
VKWEHRSTLYSYKRGIFDNKLIPVSEDEADQIVERIQRQVSGTT